MLGDLREDSLKALFQSLELGFLALSSSISQRFWKIMLARQTGLTRSQVDWHGYFLRRLYKESKKLVVEGNLWKFKSIVSYGMRINLILFAYFQNKDKDKSMTRPFYTTKIMLRDNNTIYKPVDSDLARALVVAEDVPEVLKKKKKKKKKRAAEETNTKVKKPTAKSAPTVDEAIFEDEDSTNKLPLAKRARISSGVSKETLKLFGQPKGASTKVAPSSTPLKVLPISSVPSTSPHPSPT
ncbi:hypothetical protein ACS0TY_013312 [Phlomoides rotata]